MSHLHEYKSIWKKVVHIIYEPIYQIYYITENDSQCYGTTFIHSFAHGQKIKVPIEPIIEFDLGNFSSFSVALIRMCTNNYRCDYCGLPTAPFMNTIRNGNVKRNTCNNGRLFGAVFVC